MGREFRFRLKKVRGHRKLIGSPLVCVWIWTGPLHEASQGDYVDPFGFRLEALIRAGLGLSWAW
jgi:hypothetical protein